MTQGLNRFRASWGFRGSPGRLWMPQPNIPLAGARQVSYVYITAALRKCNGRFRIIIETPMPNKTKAVVAETCIDCRACTGQLSGDPGFCIKINKIRHTDHQSPKIGGNGRFRACRIQKIVVYSREPDGIRYILIRIPLQPISQAPYHFHMDISRRRLLPQHDIQI